VDVYIANRKNRLGQMYAFCRYIKVSNSDTLIDSLSKVWIGKLRLHAKVARFERNAVQNNSRTGVKLDTPIVNSARFQCSNKDSSYANVAKAATGEEKRGSKDVVDDSGEQESEINLQECDTNDFPLAILGCYKDFRSIANAHILCRCEGFLEVDIKYLGGLWVLFEFRTVETRNKFLKHKGISSWFSSLKPWYNEFVVTERLVWLEIEGVPLRAWNNDTFTSIGSKWGEVLFCDDSDSSNRLSKRICNKSTHFQLIFTTMMVSLKKVTYAIRVRELCSWTPSFVDEDSCKDEGSMGSYNHDQEEEGEIRENEVDVHAVIHDGSGDQHVKLNDDYIMDTNKDVEVPHTVKSSGVEPQIVEPTDSDPFGLASLINKKSGKAFDSKQSETPEFPPGFSPAPNIYKNASNSDVSKLKSSGSDSVNNQPPSDSHKPIGFSLVERLEETIKVGLALGLNMEGCENTVATLIANNGELIVDK
jgi:hypothetical protein